MITNDQERIHVLDQINDQHELYFHYKRLI